MLSQTYERFVLNYYTLWVYYWFYFYQNNIIKFSPYHVYLLCIIHDLIFLKKNNITKVFIVRMCYIVLMHYMPLFILKKDFSTESILFNIFLFSIYLSYLKLNNFTIQNVYQNNTFSDNTSIDTYFNIRFGNKYIAFFYLFAAGYISYKYL